MTDITMYSSTLGKGGAGSSILPGGTIFSRISACELPSCGPIPGSGCSECPIDPPNPLRRRRTAGLCPAVC
ncbi:MAG: hypothetical protein HOK99_00705 [Betaproteobacteria bacterium]|nr:hypothetical protein [Betaproteobacteria bacterium]